MFEHVEFTEQMVTPQGLKPALLRDLRQVVILAGENGSGKSRYLALLPTALNNAASRRRIVQVRDALPQQLPGQGPMRRSLAAPQPHTVEQANQMLAPLGRSQTKSDKSTFVHIKMNELQNTVANQGPQSVAQMVGMAKSRPNFSVTTTYNALHSHVLAVALCQWLPNISDYKDDTDFAKNTEYATTFNKLLETLLFTSISFEFERHTGNLKPMLFGRPFNPQELSPGQRILLAWAFSLHAQTGGTELPDSAVIAIDEPEVHLHPSLSADVLNRLHERIIKGTGRQLWLATHSPSTVAQFAAVGDVYLVAKGGIQRAGRNVASAMNGLLIPPTQSPNSSGARASLALCCAHVRPTNAGDSGKAEPRWCAGFAVFLTSPIECAASVGRCGGDSRFASRSHRRGCRANTFARHTRWSRDPPSGRS